MIVNVTQAADIIINGGLVAVPTETVYGLAAKFNDQEAVKKIYQLKNRPLDHPLILHIGSKDWLQKYTLDIPDYVYTLIDHFWPGPLTLVLNKTNVVGDYITAGQKTIAIRMPSHPDILKLIQEVGEPLVAPSANKFCKTSPTTSEHVINNFGSDLPVIDGGKCTVGIESTIISVVEKNLITLLRPGLITCQEIESVSKISCHTCESTIKVPGNLKLHYQPELPLYSFSNYMDISKKFNDNKRYFCMLINDYQLPEKHTVFQMPNNPINYAKTLYDTWQSIDENLYDAILIELPPENVEWAGVRDRIFKASQAL